MYGGLRYTSKPVDSMSVLQHKALKSLTKRDDWVILKADKQNATVVMGKLRTVQGEGMYLTATSNLKDTSKQIQKGR